MDDDLDALLADEEELEMEAQMMDMSGPPEPDAIPSASQSQANSQQQPSTENNSQGTVSTNILEDMQSDNDDKEEGDDTGSVSSLDSEAVRNCVRQRRKDRLYNARRRRKEEYFKRGEVKEDLSKYVFTRPGTRLKGDMAITLPNGDLRYIMVSPDKDPFNRDYTADHDDADASDDDSNEEGFAGGENSSFLERSYDMLIAELDEREVSKGLEVESADEQAPSRKRKKKSRKQRKKERLLVDKYSPRKFVDLISDERVNLAVVEWLNSWHDFVFKKQKSERPDQLVIMLHGPPGAGKTTLARVIAKHCGYLPEEINASDERTGDVILQKLRGAMEMKSMFTTDKPKCVILDEFEGISNQSQGRNQVQKILNVINAPLENSTNRKNKGGKSDSPAFPLTRPLILICNDPWSALLRPIRIISKLIKVEKVPNAEIVQRLNTICHLESIRPHSGAVHALVKSHSGDIRGCLHGLQFAVTTKEQADGKSKKKMKELRLESVKRLCSHEKDQSSDIYRTWKLIFQGRRQVERNAMLNELDKRKSISRTEFEINDRRKLWRSLEGHFSEFPKLLDGIHENMVKADLAPSRLPKLVEALDMLCIANEYQKSTHKVNFDMFRYVPAIAMSLHDAVRTDSRVIVSRPELDFEYRNKLRENTEILSTLSETRQGHSAGSLYNNNVLAVDVIPPLLEIMNPKVRAIPWNLLNKNEKERVQNVVDILFDFGVTAFSGVKREENQLERYVYRPQPRIDKLVSYDESFQYETLHSVPHFTTLKLIGERLSTLRLQHEQQGQFKEKSSLSLQKVQPSSSMTAQDISVARDFFGNEIVETTQPRNRKRSYAPKEQREEDDEIANNVEQTRKRKNAGIVYVYREGYTNAVRRPVFVEDLLGDD